MRASRVRSRCQPALLAAGLGLLLAGCRTAPAPGARQLSDDIAAFLQRYSRERPVWATEVGFHAHDAALDDLSAVAIANRVEWLRDAERQFASFEAGSLSLDDRVDRDVVLGRIHSDLFDLDTLHTWRTSPLLYTQLAGNSIRSLLAYDYAPLDARLAATRSRLLQLPRLLQQARANLQHPPRVQTEAALRQSDSLIRLVRDGVLEAAAAGGASPGLELQLRAASDTAVAALAAFQEFLAEDLLRRSDGNFRLGRARFDRALAVQLRSDLDSDAIRARADAERQRVRRAMYDLAAPLWRASHPGRALPPPATDAGIDAVVAPVLAAIASDHPRADEILDVCRAAVDSLTRFVARTGLVTLDPRRQLVVEWTPPFGRGVTEAGLTPPGPLDRELPIAYDVQPIPADWTPAQSESFLREYNRHLLQVLSMHEAVPGHFVQLCHAERCPRLVRKVFANDAFAEGWAVYAERLAVDAGYGGGDPRLRLAQLKFYLRSVLNAQLAVGVHCDGMTESEALALLTRDGFQEESEARAKWLRAELGATQLCTYFVGVQAILDLEARDRERAGAGWSQRDFTQRLLSHGAPAPRELGRLLFASGATAGAMASAPAQ